MFRKSAPPLLGLFLPGGLLLCGDANYEGGLFFVWFVFLFHKASFNISIIINPAVAQRMIFMAVGAGKQVNGSDNTPPIAAGRLADGSAHGCASGTPG